MIIDAKKVAAILLLLILLALLTQLERLHDTSPSNDKKPLFAGVLSNIKHMSLNDNQ